VHEHGAVTSDVWRLGKKQCLTNLLAGSTSVNVGLLFFAAYRLAGVSLLMSQQFIHESKPTPAQLASASRIFPHLVVHLSHATSAKLHHQPDRQTCGTTTRGWTSRRTANVSIHPGTVLRGTRGHCSPPE